MKIAGHIGTAKAWTRLLPLASLALLLLGHALPAAAAQGDMLPSTFGAWTLSGAESRGISGDVSNFAGDNAAVLREYGINSAEQGSYSQGGRDASVTLYRMADPSGAFGAFTFLRDPKMQAVTLGPSVGYAAAVRDRALLVVGNLLLDVSSSSGRPADRDLRLLADGFFSQASRSPYPLLVGFLPKAGLVPNSERYVLGVRALAQAFPAGAASARDWIGFNKSAEAVVASYNLNSSAQNNPALLLIALYPTQQVAADRYGDLNRWLALNPSSAQTDGRPVVFGKRTGAFIALLSGAESAQAAQAFLDRIQDSPQVTWNAPTHELTDPSIGAIVVGAIMGTGTIMLLAIVAGIGFGGFRIFIKFLFPGKVFDRNEQVEILQLGLSSKPIHTEDFYGVDSSKDR